MCLRAGRLAGRGWKPTSTTAHAAPSGAWTVCVGAGGYRHAAPERSYSCSDSETRESQRPIPQHVANGKLRQERHVYSNRASGTPLAP